MVNSLWAKSRLTGQFAIDQNSFGESLAMSGEWVCARPMLPERVSRLWRPCGVCQIITPKQYSTGLLFARNRCCPRRGWAALLALWCAGGDSNPQALRHKILNLARIPIPPLAHAEPQGARSMPTSQINATRVLNVLLQFSPVVPISIRAIREGI